ncbi:MAG: type 4a pilus biogenesis protein PilO [Rhodocyclaceae bacterium]|nr:type 4a pilus biogenesis protein PilO [Rhodocyclaceae bacterium]
MKRPTLPKIDFRGVVDDFRGLTNDVGTWPLAPRAAVLVALFALIVVAGWWFVWQEQLDTLEQQRAEEVRLKQDFLNKKRQAVNLDLHLQQLNEIDRSFGALLKQLPNKAEVASLLVEINQAGLGRGLQFELFKPGAEQVKEFYAELPISVKLVGSYHDFGAFAGDIGRLSRIVTLNNVSISVQKDNVLVLDAVTKTFRYLDEEEIARQKKAAQAAKRGRR